AVAGAGDQLPAAVFLEVVGLERDVHALEGRQRGAAHRVDRRAERAVGDAVEREVHVARARRAAAVGEPEARAALAEQGHRQHQDHQSGTIDHSLAPLRRGAIEQWSCQTPSRLSERWKDSYLEAGGAGGGAGKRRDPDGYSPFGPPICHWKAENAPGLRGLTWTCG